MKIDNLVKSVGGPTSGARKDGAKPAATPQPAVQSEAVALSPLSARLQEIASSLANTPVADSERVSAIREAISQGNFKINAGKIADGLIDSVRQMLAAQK